MTTVLDMLVMAPPDGRCVDARLAVINEAHAILRVHIVDGAGVCDGCLDVARLAPVACPESRRALSVVETLGVAMWDVPSATARPG